MALGGLAVVAFWRLIVWIRDSPVLPDPWDADVERQLSEAVEVCPHCLTEQPPTAWFCKRCGRAVGPYNNLMPYVQVFSEGEVFRNGMNGQFRNRPLILAGYFLVFLGTMPFLAPLYFLWLFAGRGKGPATGAQKAGPMDSQD